MSGELRVRTVPKGAITMALVLLVASAYITTARVRGMDEPLEPDIVTYATIGHELVEGRRLYTDVWDVKPPGLYETYALGERIAGRGPAGVFFVGWIAAMVTLAAVCLAGWAQGPSAGLVAAALWAVLGQTIALQANQPNSEVFINALATLGFAAWATAPPSRPAWTRALLCGASFALASTYKPVAVFPAAFLAVAHWRFPPTGVSRRTALAQAGVVSACFAAVWGAIFAFAAATGQLAIYWHTNVTANGARTAGVLFNLYRYLREWRFFPSPMLFLLLLIIVIVGAAVAAWRAGVRRPWALLGAWALGAHFMIFTQGGAFHLHSYQFWLPLLAVGGGWACTDTFRERTSARRTFVACALAAILVHDLPVQLRSPVEWARAKHGDSVVEDRAFARAIGATLGPDETAFQLGDGAAIYFYGSLRPPTPTLWASYLLWDTPLAAELGARTLQALEARPPELVILQAPEEWVPHDLVDGSPRLAFHLLRWIRPERAIPLERSPVYAWTMARYALVPAETPFRSSHLAVYARRDGAFIRRLTAR